MDNAQRPERDQVYCNFPGRSPGSPPLPSRMDSRRWDGFRPRQGDIIISSPPKAGTTWMQMICALLILQKTELEQSLTAISPWLDQAIDPIERVLAALEQQSHRRFIKTHTPLDGLPYFSEVIYLALGRDPRDIFVSQDHHYRNMYAGADRTASSGRGRGHASVDALRESFRRWIADDGRPWQADGPNGASRVFHHSRTFWKYRELPNIHLVHYSDLKSALEDEMRRIARHLGISVPEARWAELVSAATFPEMRQRADRLAPNVDKQIWRENRLFFYRGTNGQWREVLGERELALYRRALAAELEPALAHWLESGTRDASCPETEATALNRQDGLSSPP